MTWCEVRGDVVVLACAASAGIHAALVPAHGVPFVVVAALLVALAIALTRRPASALAHGSAALVFAGVIVSYALATTTGLPVLHPDPERADGLGLATKAIEAAGLLAALPRTKGALRWTSHGLRAPSRSH